MTLGRIIFGCLLFASSLTFAAPVDLPTTLPSIPAVLDPNLVTNLLNGHGILQGDWESSGDIYPGAGETPTYDFRYDCRVEMTGGGMNSAGLKLFAIADFMIRKNGPSKIESKDLKWSWVTLSADGTERLYRKPPFPFASRDQLTIYPYLLSAEQAKAREDQIVVNLGVALAVNPDLKKPDTYWVSKSTTLSTARSQESFMAKVDVDAYAPTPGPKSPTLSRAVELMCRKVK